MTGARSATSARHPLRRPAGDRLLLGVCAGIARSLDLSPLAVRLGAVVLAAVAAPLVLAGYVIAAAIVPRDDGRALLGGVPADRRESVLGWTLVATVLITFAAAEFRLEELVWPGLSSFGIFAAAAGALALIAASQRRATMSAAAAPAAAASAATAPASSAPGSSAPSASAPTTSALDSSDSDEAAPDEAAPDEAAPDEAAPDEAPPHPSEAATAAFAHSSPPTATQPVPPPAPRGLSLGTIAAAVALIAGAVVFLLDAIGAIDPSATEVAVGLAVAAALAGAGAIAGAVTARRGVLAMLALGLVLGGSAAAVGLLSTELDDGVGFRTERPASVSEIPETYRLGAGELDVDLRATDLPPGVTTVRARIGAGELTVLVPPGVRVQSVGPTHVDGVPGVNAALPDRRPAVKSGAKKRGKARERAAAPRTTIRIDADVREGNAGVVRGAP